MYRELKENKPHGTRAYPYTQYFIHNATKAFHVPVHWHDEVELIYIKKGKITIVIEEEVFHAKQGDLFLCFLDGYSTVLSIVISKPYCFALSSQRL